MILGFGIQEEKAARQIIQECIDNITSNNDLCSAVETVHISAKTRAEKYDKQDRHTAPERYTYFYYFLPCKTLVEFTMFHINRNHAFSQDGWALLQTKWALSIQEDNTVIYRE